MHVEMWAWAFSHFRRNSPFFKNEFFHLVCANRHMNLDKLNIRITNCFADLVPSCERPIASHTYCHKHEQCGNRAVNTICRCRAHAIAVRPSFRRTDGSNEGENEEKQSNLMLTRALNIT